MTSSHSQHTSSTGVWSQQIQKALANGTSSKHAFVKAASVIPERAHAGQLTCPERKIYKKIKK